MLFGDRRRWNFHALDGTASAGKIIGIVDRNGNTISFDYDGFGRLTRVTDTLERDIDIAYNNKGLIESLTDFSGRVVRYSYYGLEDINGNDRDLKSVTYPTVTGTPNDNDFPEGKTWVYTYSRGFSNSVSRLNRNLLTITDDRGNTYLKNEYHEISPRRIVDGKLTIDINYDRIKCQTWGNDGDIIDFTYIPIEPSNANGLAVMKVILNDRNGNVNEFFYDRFNRPVREREYTGRANPDQPTTETRNRATGKMRSSDPDFFETLYEWNSEFLLCRIIHPNGNITQNIHEFDLNLNAPTRTRGNLRVVRHLPGTHTPIGDQEVIEELFEYDTSFGNACCGFNFVTRSVDGRGNSTVNTFDTHGNPIKRVSRIQSIIEEWEYNEFGQMTKNILPKNGSNHRRVDAYTYYTHEEDDDQEGYRKEEVIDVGGFNLTTSYEYDLVGNTIRKTDPRGHDMQYIVNELDQVVREISREVTDGSNIRYEKDYFYDENDNLIQIDIQNISDQGTLQSINTHFTTKFEYEILNYLTHKSEEIGFRRSEDVLVISFINTNYEYDANRNQTLIKFGEATAGRQPANTIRTIYDERDLPFRHIRAPGNSDQSSTQLDYDPNKNTVRISVGLEDTPRIINKIYDAYNRPIESVDNLGNIGQYHYDANHNQVSQIILGELQDEAGSETNIRLSEAFSGYDAMDRQTRKIHAFFAPESQTPLSDGQSITLTDYSDNSQIIRVINDNNHATEIAYDTVNRRSIVTDAKGNSATYNYDANSNVTKTVSREKSDSGKADELFSTSFAYDGLDRKIQNTDNVGNINRGRYDSRNNYTLFIDALGNTTRYRYDGINRLVSTIRILTDDGNGNGNGNVTDEILTRQTWDSTSRLIEQIDDNGNVTAYTYDALNRKIATTYADNTTHTSTYDVHDNRIAYTDANGTSVTCNFDILNRQLGKNIVPSSGVSNATTSEIYRYDGLSRLVHAEDNDSKVVRQYDSLNQTTKEELWIGDPATEMPDGTTLTRYDGIGNMLSCTYPGGRNITCAYDELERKKIISDANGTIATYDYVGPSRVERRDYGNGTRLEMQYDGITGVANPANDFGVKQIIGTKHTRIADGVILDEWSFTWDKMYNKTQRTDQRSDGPQRNHNYEYDSIYRLQQAKVLDDSVNNIRDTQYTFDGVHNRTEVTGNPNPGTYTLDNTIPDPADFSTNQYTTTSTDSREYDLNGNLTIIDATTASPITLTYDYRNQMVSYDNPDTSIASQYAYDALGRRIQKQVNGDATLYFYTDWRVCEEQNKDNATQATYVYGLYLDEVLTMQRDGTDVYYHCDDLYNITALSDTNGTVSERYDYNDYGMPFSVTGTDIVLLRILLSQ